MKKDKKVIKQYGSLNDGHHVSLGAQIISNLLANGSDSMVAGCGCLKSVLLLVYA